MICPSCGSTVTLDDSICSSCQASLQDFSTDYCVYCRFKDKKDSSGRSYCEVCGLKKADLKGTSEPRLIDEPRLSSEVLGASSSHSREKKGTLKQPFELKPWMILGTVLIVLVAFLFFFQLKLRSNAQAEQLRADLEFASTYFDQYRNIVQEMGEIGNEVYQPMARDFEVRREKALQRLDKLEESIKKELKKLEEREVLQEFAPLKNHLVKAFRGLLDIDIKELRYFIQTIDTSLVNSMMEGELSQTPFQKAVTVSSGVGEEIDEAIELWYELSYKYKS
jgi:hypothetical protein